MPLVQSRSRSCALSAVYKKLSEQSSEQPWIWGIICAEIQMPSGMGTVSPETGVGWVGEYRHLQMAPETFALNWNIFFPRSTENVKEGSSLWTVTHTPTTESIRAKKPTRPISRDLHPEHFTDSGFGTCSNESSWLFYDLLMLLLQAVGGL